MDNTFYPHSSRADIINSSSGEEESSEEEDYLETRFSNMVKKTRYEKYRKKLFTPDIIRKKIVVDSHNYFQGDESFNTSNFDVLFDFERKSGESSSSLITTNYEIYNNVISFKLLKTTIRTPPYNINKTNNVIAYKVDGKIYTITINPGQYEVGELASSLQKYDARYKAQSSDNTTKNINQQYSQYVTYDDPKVIIPVGTTIDENLSVASSDKTPNTFRVTFLDTDETRLQLPSSESGRALNGIINKFEYFPDSERDSENNPLELIMLWDYNNITRGAARLFGFLPKETHIASYSAGAGVDKKYEFFSDRLLDVSSHFVDLVIPEIPSISCKRNSSGRDIIERIQLRAGHGEYLHYRTAESDLSPVYFNPMKLHRITIQLWAQNNEIYDTNNSDVSFEFEITMLKNIDLLR
jgi:hypothetical protein